MRKRELSSAQLIIVSFICMILIGSFLLMLPISSSAGVFTSFKDALFTATSASCVTGLVVQDTGTYWSFFGQLIILILIQVGGMGVVTMAALLFIFTGKKIGLRERNNLSDSISAFNIGGILRVTTFIIKTVLLVEGIGAIVLLPTFVRDFGLKGIWFAIFHSISAFCNAGFDLLGCRSPYSSLTSYAANPFVLLPIASLIVIGGIGFFTWDDIRTHKFNFHSYRLQTKIILSTTFFLIIIPMLYFYIFEFGDLPLKQRALASIFQSITPRTAGFNSEDYAALSQSGQFLTIILMLIGGASGSTAGGIKVATFAILCAVTFTIIVREEETNLFNRRIPMEIIYKCISILTLYIVLMIISTMLVSRIENIPIIVAGFECASALGTVGLTLGITPTLSANSHIILIFLMYIGRVGGLTILFATTQSRKRKSKNPLEKVSVG